MFISLSELYNRPKKYIKSLRSSSYLLSSQYEDLNTIFGVLETVLAEIQEGGELDFKNFFKTILSFQKMQVSLINWIFIDFTKQSSRMNQPTEYNPVIEQCSKPNSFIRIQI